MFDPIAQDPETLISLPRQRIFFQADTHGCIVACNDLMAQFLGSSEAGLSGVFFPELALPSERQGALNLLEDALKGQPNTGYIAFYTPSGRKLAQTTLVPHFQNGQPAGAFGFLHDATDRIEKTRRLIESERQYKDLYERYQFVSQATSDVLWDWNLQTNAIYINNSFTRVLGFDIPETDVNDVWRKNLHPDDRERVIQCQQAALADDRQSFWEDQYRFVRPDGSVMYLNDRAVIIRDASGKPLRMIGAVHDVTSQKESELLLQRGERRFRAMVQSGLDVVILLDRNFVIRYVSPNAFILSGYAADEVMGVLGFEGIHPADYAGVIEKGIRITTVPKVLLPPFRYRLKDGSYSWVEATLSNHLADPDIDAIVINMRDITQRMETEEAILLSEEKYRLLFYQSPEPKWIFRREDLRFVEVNDAALEHYGYTREEFLAMTVIDLQPPGERERVLRMLTGDFMPAGRMQNISQHMTKDGSIISVELTTHGIYLASGYHVLVNANDVTEKLALEQKVLEEKITAQKAIARTIINTQEKERSEIGKELHDNVNQILTTAKLYIENIGYYPDQQETYVSKSAALLQRAITEIRNLSKALVTPVLYDIGLRATIEELIEQYRALQLFVVNFSFDAKEEKVENGLQLTIYRILQEQLNNITKHAQASKVSVEVSATDTSIRICIADDGVGFDPQQKRSGLGLNNMRNRIDVFKGEMHIRTAENAGCSICITFPLQ
ncbi:MAG: PAS domain S-box protein [Chitinophagaceae bacterium]|nr:MAG: PAS domain S-box protein [Chitinophagaceae bacterium]